jgi:hypothetical protein
MVARESMDSADVTGVPSHVGGDVGVDVGNDTLSDVMGDHAIGAGRRRGHAENPGVAFLTSNAGSGVLGWAICHGDAHYFGQSQQEHVVEQHAGWGFCFC